MNFAIVGVGGFVAPRHLQAIRDTGHKVTMALDVNDSVGILDSYFPESEFFTVPECFEQELAARRPTPRAIDYVTVCSPNHLHTAHVCMGLRHGANVICEKPLALDLAELSAIEDAELLSQKRVATILQLRVHPEIKALADRIDNKPDEFFEIDISYVTPRGPWYRKSWKGDVQKSGGILMNIGVHLFDVLIWLFGRPQAHVLREMVENQLARGFLEFNRASVQWTLSVDRADLPAHFEKPYRMFKVNGDEVNLSNVFRSLHTASYEHILNAGGFAVEDVRTSIELVNSLRCLPH